MALVDYSSDSEDGSDAPQQPASEAPRSVKRKVDDTTDLPPLPTSFHNLYTTSARVSTRDDPSLHGGRTRATPHIEGNWPTHLYIEWYPSTAEYAALNDVINTAKDCGSQKNPIETHLISDLGAPLPLHVSLSAPIGFATQTKDDFLEAIRQKIASCGVKPFDLKFAGLKWHPNFSKTRWFLVLTIVRPSNDELNEILAVCNQTVERYGQPPLYAEPSGDLSKGIHPDKKLRTTSGLSMKPVAIDKSDAFHVSIGWSLSPPDHDDELSLSTITTTKDFQDIKRIAVFVEEIKVKIGNEITCVKLSSKPKQDKTLFGF